MSDLTFLQEASPDRLETAVAWNHQERMILRARAAGGEVRQDEGVMWTYAGSEGEAMIPFPRLAAATAGEQLDAIVQYYLDRRPEKLVGCWSLDPPQPPDLGVWLLARGFQVGWRPRWMALDLRDAITGHSAPDGLSILPDESESAHAPWDVDDLPYYNHSDAALRSAVRAIFPQRVWHFAARLDGKVVGQSALFLTTGPLGVAGIYDVGVVPGARNQGVGKAVILAACLHARALGARYAMLNATGEPMYRQIGFETIGYGFTWWLNVPRLAARPAERARIALAEAVGRGDLDALSVLDSERNAQDLDAPLANEMTLMQLAAHCRQPASAEWLAAHGATLDLLSAWDLGWKDRVSALLSENPALADRLCESTGMTPLHDAVERNDIEFVRVLLAAGADLTIQDRRFHGTPLGWAKHFQRTEIIALMEQHLG